MTRFAFAMRSGAKEHCKSDLTGLDQLGWIKHWVASRLAHKDGDYLPERGRTYLEQRVTSHHPKKTRGLRTANCRGQRRMIELSSESVHDCAIDDSLIHRHDGSVFTDQRIAGFSG